MLAHFYIHSLLNDMKIAVQKTHLDGQILYRSLVPSKKRRHKNIKSFLTILRMYHMYRMLIENNIPKVTLNPHNHLRPIFLQPFDMSVK